MPARRTDHQVWRDVAMAQEGLISRAQLIRLGLPADLAEGRLRSGRWSRRLPGVYDTVERSGSLPELGRVWTGVLYAGPGAAASHGTALWLFKVIDRLPAVIQISVPQPRQVRAQPGLLIRRAQALEELLHPVLEPPRTRVEVAVLDYAERCACADEALDAVLRATQRWLTTAARLRDELHRRSRHRWRTLLTEVLDDVAEGASTPLERRYARDVERAHGLPPGRRNHADRSGPAEPTRYRDVEYLPWNLIVETDGREAHPRDEAFRDMRRDNAQQMYGKTTLRYGYRDVAGKPCEVALQVAAVLQLNGWPGAPRPCGPGCIVSQV